MNSHMKEFTHLCVEMELLGKASRMDKKSRETECCHIFFFNICSKSILEHFIKNTEIQPKHFQESLCI